MPSTASVAMLAAIPPNLMMGKPTMNATRAASPPEQSPMERPATVLGQAAGNAG